MHEMTTYSWQQREVAFVLDGCEVMNVTPTVVEHTQSSVVELL